MHAQEQAHNDKIATLGAEVAHQNTVMHLRLQLVQERQSVALSTGFSPQMQFHTSKCSFARLGVLCGKPKETYRTNQTKQTTSNVFCTSKKRKNPKSSSKEMNRKIFSKYFENYFENFYKYISCTFPF